MKLITLILLCVSASLPLLAAPLLAPRQAATGGAVRMATGPNTNRVDYVQASKTVGTVVYRWHGTAWATNVARFTFVDLTNTPSTPRSQVAISWSAPVTLLASQTLDAATWEKLPATAITTVTLPLTGPAQFFRAPLPTQSVQLTWEPITSPTVTGLNIYYGTNSGSYTSLEAVGNVTEFTLAGLQPGVTYYFAATARDNDGLESDRSNEVTYSVPLSEINPTITTR